MEQIKSFDDFVNEAAKITPKDLTHEGEEAVKFLERIFRNGTVKKMDLENNTIEITFEQNLDLTEDLFSMAQKWPTAPSHLGLFVDVMSVNRGYLVMMVYGKPGLHFTL
jgi:hypothetical protein